MPATDIVHNADAIHYGATPLDRNPGLWRATRCTSTCTLARCSIGSTPPSIDPIHPTMAIPLSNGYEWAYRVGGVGPGECCVVLGPGQQSLARVAAAKEAGASPVVVAGLGSDAHRLATARELGADVVVDVEQADLTEIVRHLTGGAMSSVVVHTAAGDAVTTGAAFRALRKGGMLVLAARQKEPIQFEINQVRDKALALRGVRGHSYRAVEWALNLLASVFYGTEILRGTPLALKEFDVALAAVANGEVIHACMDPWR